MRMRPARSALSNAARFSVVSATAMSLMPSPFPLGPIETASDEVPINVMFAARDQRARARRTAPSPSLPCLIFDGGEIKDRESAILIVLAGHLTRRPADLSAYWSV